MGNRLFDNEKEYYYLDKISEKFKLDDGPLQDFLNMLEGNRVLSLDDKIFKFMAQSILLGDRVYKQNEIRGCFKRYNAYTNRLLMEADESIIQKEICLQGSYS